MSKIVEFASRHNPASMRTGPSGQTQPCEIVIFPGVRYERWNDAPAKPNTPEPAPGKKSRRQKA